MMSVWVKPILKAFLLCDQTIVEEQTRKRSLIGIFDRIRAARFPLIHPNMSVYVQFTDFQGEHRFALELVDLSDELVVARAVIERYQSQDRTRDCELVFNLHSLEIKKAGDYEFRIFVDDGVFGQKSFKVLG